jgi:hypothetical protein
MITASAPRGTIPPVAISVAVLGAMVSSGTVPGGEDVRIRDSALLFDVIAGRRGLDEFDMAPLIGLGEIKRDHGIVPRRQGIAGINRAQWHLDRIVRARSQRRVCLEGKSVKRRAIAVGDRAVGADVFRQYPPLRAIQRGVFYSKAMDCGVDPGDCRVDRQGGGEGSHCFHDQTSALSPGASTAV